MEGLWGCRGVAHGACCGAQLRRRQVVVLWCGDRGLAKVLLLCSYTSEHMLVPASVRWARAGGAGGGAAAAAAATTAIEWRGWSIAAGDWYGRVGHRHLGFSVCAGGVVVEQHGVPPHGLVLSQVGCGPQAADLDALD